MCFSKRHGYHRPINQCLIVKQHQCILHYEPAALTSSVAFYTDSLVQYFDLVLLIQSRALHFARAMKCYFLQSSPRQSLDLLVEMRSITLSIIYYPNSLQPYPLLILYTFELSGSLFYLMPFHFNIYTQ